MSTMDDETSGETAADEEDETETTETEDSTEAE
jgi:hypothetical protein